MTKATINELTPDQAKAILAFREKVGPSWKRTLQNAWMRGDYPRFTTAYSHLLQQVRNQKGPSWLQKLTFTETIKVTL